MIGLEVMVVLGITLLLGTTLSERYGVASPVLLLPLGVPLGLVPALSDVVVPPSVVLLILLPPLLYWESCNTSLREIRANLLGIVPSSVVLVLVTAAAVAGVAQVLGMDPGAAWVLGAVLAPTDASAVGGLAKDLPRRTLTTLRAESLINDGTALVLFSAVVTATVARHHVSVTGLGGRFVLSYGGGLLIGLLLAGLSGKVWNRIHDPLREGAVSVLLPFIAAMAAELLHTSAVVAAVACGLALTQTAPRLVQARSRLSIIAFWELSTFLLTGGLFVLAGLHLPAAVRELSTSTLSRATAIALVVSFVVIGSRLLWVHCLNIVVRSLDRRPAQRLRRVGWRHRTLWGWSGFRGPVSLAAALAVPASRADGSPFPDRDLIILITALVVLITMTAQGLTFPAVLRWAQLPDDDSQADELRYAREQAVEAGLAALPRLASELGVTNTISAEVRREYEEHAQALHNTGQLGVASSVARVQRQRLRLRVLAAQRETVVRLRDDHHIDDIVLRELQTEIDNEEVRLQDSPSTTT